MRQCVGDRPFPRAAAGASPAALLIAIGVTGCETTIGPSSSEAVPVIQSLLVAGDSVQTAWVEWRIPADSGFGPEVRPVAPALVQISLVLPSGSVVAFTPARAVPGRFDVAVLAAPGFRYRLVGTVAGLSVSAEAMVPGQLSIRIPEQDTVSLGEDSCAFFCQLPYRWFAEGTGAYLYLQSRADRLVWRGSTSDTTGVISLVQERVGGDTVNLAVFALEPNAAAFLLPATPKSSITGVFGLFGAASHANRWIVLP